MKIVSLNIRHGGGKRWPGIMAWLDHQAADFIVLTEWRDNAGTHLKEAIEDAGYMSWGQVRTANANGILIASKQSLEVTRLTPRTSSNGEILAADLKGGLRILGCYFPQLEAKKPFFETCIEQVAEANGPLLLVGERQSPKIFKHRRF